MEIAAQPGFQGEVHREDQETVRTVVGSSFIEGFAGLAAIVLAIIGLTGGFPVLALSVATIAVGAALLFEGGAISYRLNALVNDFRGTRRNIDEIGGGMSAEFVSGAVGVVLGVLALIGLAPVVLVSIAAIVYGAGLMLGASSTARLNAFIAHKWTDDPEAQEITGSAVYAASSVQVLVGLGAITLGVLALIGIFPLTLTLVSMLSVGGADLLSGGAIGSRIQSVFHHA